MFFAKCIPAGSANGALQRTPSTHPLLYFYFYQWIIIWSKVILIFCLNRLQLNIHSFWRGLLCSVFGMCVTETKGCALICKEIRHHYSELNNLFHWSEELWVKHFPLAQISDFVLEYWNKTKTVRSLKFAIQSLIEMRLQGSSGPRATFTAWIHLRLHTDKNVGYTHYSSWNYVEIILINSKSTKVPEFTLIKNSIKFPLNTFPSITFH